METYPHLNNDTYDMVERVMHPLALRQTRRPQSDRGKARRSVSSSSSHHQGTSSHQHDDDDDDVETSRANVLEIFMQQFWYTIKKVQDTDSYEFLLANKKCIVNAGLFGTILNICPRVEGEDFIDVLDPETALTFLLDPGYKGPLNRHTNMC
uniref:Uncharacterized protein n=1 Tax=Tanacetum cinerariifolium TaxID=118510 RepID=A0A699H1Z5_TANCI|nr:hypothetical protein [Tanacetum cinerariifolium]